MLRKWFVVPVVGCLALLVVADAVQAQQFRLFRMDRRMDRRARNY